MNPNEPNENPTMHSPLPWRFNCNGPEMEVLADNGNLIWSENFGDIPSERHAELIAAQSLANAALVVQSVNSHTVLVEALRECKELIGQQIIFLDEWQQAQAVITRAETALNNATKP